MFKKEKSARHRLDCSLPYIDVLLKSRALTQHIHGRASSGLRSWWPIDVPSLYTIHGLVFFSSYFFHLRCPGIHFSIIQLRRNNRRRYGAFSHAWTRHTDRPRITLFGTLWAETPFLLFLITDGKWGFPSIASSHWSYRSPNFWTRQSCFLSSNWFLQCEHGFIDKSVVITESAVQRMLNKNATRLTQSLSYVLRNRAKERKALRAGWLSDGYISLTSLNVRIAASRPHEFLSQRSGQAIDKVAGGPAPYYSDEGFFLKV